MTKKNVNEKMLSQKKLVAMLDEMHNTSRYLFDGYQCVIDECLPEALRTLQAIRSENLDAYASMEHDGHTHR